MFLFTTAFTSQPSSSTFHFPPSLCYPLDANPTQLHTIDLPQHVESLAAHPSTTLNRAVCRGKARDQSPTIRGYEKLRRLCRTIVSGTVPKRPTGTYLLQVARSPSPTLPNLPTKETAADPPPHPTPAHLLQLPRSQELLLNREYPLQQELLLNRYGEIIEISSASIDKVRHYGSM